MSTNQKRALPVQVLDVETGLTGGLSLAHCAGVPLLTQTLPQTRLLPTQLVPVITGPSLLIPDTLDSVTTGDTGPRLQYVTTLTWHEPHDVPLGLTVESSVEVDTAVVADRGVTKPDNL